MAVLVGYVVIGVLVALSPLGRAEIAKQVRVVRGDPFANAITGWEAPPEWKAALFRVLLTLGLVLLADWAGGALAGEAAAGRVGPRV